MTNDPVLIAYAARRSPKTRRVQYERIGRAYPHDTGAGLTLVLEALPISFRHTHIVLLELDESDDRRLLAEAKRRERERNSKATRNKES